MQIFDRSSNVLCKAIPIAVLGASLGASPAVLADEAEARNLLKNMSDYMAEQKIFSFDYDASLEVVTDDHQKLMLASSGTLKLSRPDKIRLTRTGGFANVEMVFDGQTMTLLGKDANIYAQAEMPGTLDHAVETLRVEYHKPVPGADLLAANVYDVLMEGVIDVKDLGSGVIGGIECDHLAFRTEELDWQIWIAQGDQPHPCRYVITSKNVDQAPQYSVQIHDWQTGDQVAADFAFENSTGAKKIDLEDLGGSDELPEHLAPGDAQ
ncbi:DUF2092 domain-containing protein [Geminicoccus roseus]|uniref:DUF2092 domain-containing protein n=1 Tax=Geminicoccus roseus TaxID=404900 RepID=UPI000555936E|nr:DUF2092 domain-containing protein [Geminicoccus roseus]